MTAASAAKGTARAIGGTLKWLLIIGALLIVIVIVAIVVSLGKAGSKSEKSSRQVNPSAFAHLHLGTPASTVRRMFGKPESTDQTEVTGFKETCWYYGILASSGSYQLCFQNGKLAAKNRY